jgi:ABC-type polysaccharide/polyol phosphate export permease
LGREVAMTSGILHLRAELGRWFYIAWFNFVVNYRKTTLGPFWLLVGPFLFIAIIGALYSQVNSADPVVFIPYLAVGLIVWTLLGGFVNTSTTVFQRNSAHILQGSMGLFGIVIVNMVSIVLEFMHQTLIILAVFLYFGISLSAYAFLSIVGLVIILANGLWLTMAFGIVGARYRDLAQITSAIMRIAFLATPVIWLADSASRGGLNAFLLYNPFYHFLELVRAPLLGQPIALTSWIAVLLITVGGFAFAAFLYKRFGRLVPLWI